MTACTAPQCVRQTVAKGLCHVHYYRQRKAQPLDTPIRPRGGLVRIAVRLAPITVDQLRGTGMGLAAAARSILECWGDGRLVSVEAGRRNPKSTPQSNSLATPPDATLT
jgi:hypothetical protein